ncbi:unnamed protein product [Boreogadus saida]
MAPPRAREGRGQASHSPGPLGQDKCECPCWLLYVALCWVKDVHGDCNLLRLQTGEEDTAPVRPGVLLT